MADQVQWRGGTSAENNAFTGAPREITVDTTNHTLRVHDGVTMGGHALLRDGSVPNMFSITNLPTANIGPVIVPEAAEMWIWVSTAYYTGYRSPLCGRPVDGHTALPLPNEIDAVGGLLSKADYPGLWGYAQQNNIVISQAIWTNSKGAHYFVDVSNTQFRVPDLRNMFRRFTGTNADAGARNFASPQADAFAHHFHNWQSWKLTGFDNTGGGNIVGADTGGSLGTVYSGVGIHGTGGAETRPVNVAFYPRIHI